MQQRKHEVADGPRFYRPELDALRFGAFLLVFARHTVDAHTRVGAALGAAGQSGVCLFFLLSAYLITELLQREDDKTRTIDLRAFYVRRVLRIWPLYFFALALARAIDWHAPHLQMSNGRLLASVLLAGNWYTYRFGLPASFALVLWSVCVEEQFYLLWPSVRRWFGSRGLTVLSAMTLPVSYVAIVWLCGRGRTDTQLWVNTWVQLQFFGLGGLLALLLRGRSPRTPTVVRWMLLAGGLFAFFASEYFFHGPSLVPVATNAIGEYACMLMGSAMLFFAVLGLAQLQRAGWLLYLGKISYGLYVFHMLGLRIALRPMLLLAAHARLQSNTLFAIQAAWGLCLTIVMAHLSYRYIESYFLRLKDRFTVVRSRSV